MKIVSASLGGTRRRLAHHHVRGDADLARPLPAGARGALLVGLAATAALGLPDPGGPRAAHVPVRGALPSKSGG